MSKDLRPLIHATLRKAGHRRSVTHASSMVRGWSTWSAGYELRKPHDMEGVVLLEYRFGTYNNQAAAEREKVVSAFLSAATAALASRFDVEPDARVAGCLVVRSKS